MGLSVIQSVYRQGGTAITGSVESCRLVVVALRWAAMKVTPSRVASAAHDSGAMVAGEGSVGGGNSPHAAQERPSVSLARMRLHLSTRAA
jgi:hypothetical protein